MIGVYFAEHYSTFFSSELLIDVIAEFSVLSLESDGNMYILYCSYFLF